MSLSPIIFSIPIKRNHEHPPLSLSPSPDDAVANDAAICDVWDLFDDEASSPVRLLYSVDRAVVRICRSGAADPEIRRQRSQQQGRRFSVAGEAEATDPSIAHGRERS